MPPLLAVRGLSIDFGGIAALSDVSFDVAKGAITGLIGPNGAGKTTCFNCISRLYQPESGQILFKGEDLLRCRPDEIAFKRIARTFQNVALFDRMTVLENVLIGYHTRFSRSSSDSGSESHANRDARTLLEQLELGELTLSPVRGLPLATRKRVELARALLSQPELLMLDEPAAGLGHDEVATLGATIRRVARDFRATILMVEHHMALVMGISDHVVVLASGRKLADGTPEAIRDNPAVVEAYLGAAV